VRFTLFFAVSLSLARSKEEGSRKRGLSRSRESARASSLSRSTPPTSAPHLHNLPSPPCDTDGRAQRGTEQEFVSPHSPKDRSPTPTNMSAQQQPQDYSEAWRQYYAAHAAYAAQHLGAGGAGGTAQVRKNEREKEMREERCSSSRPSFLTPWFFGGPTPPPPSPPLLFFPLSFQTAGLPVPRARSGSSGSPDDDDGPARRGMGSLLRVSAAAAADANADAPSP